jgi:transposase
VSFSVLQGARVFLRTGPTDMRKSIQTLALLVEAELRENLFTRAYFVFVGKQRNLIKVLYWDRNGFCLWQKRLEKDKFSWPRVNGKMELDSRRFQFLLEGLDFAKAHETLHFKAIS